jgi:FkbM family methyltransferase
MGLFRRFGLVRAFALATEDFRPPVWELLKGLVRTPSSVRAPRQIRGITASGEYLVIDLKGAERPLFWPKSLPLSDLRMVITEGCYPDDWHYYEVPETRVRIGDTVLDCGAAEGLFSLLALTRAARIFAFEPSPLFVASLERTFDGSSVTVVPCALGAVAGQARLEIGSLTSRLGGGDQGIDVSVTTIDQWVAEQGARVDLIKGDLEGSEMDVLKGAERTLAEFRPRIAITCYHPGNDWREMLRFCRSIVPSYHHRVKGISGLEPGHARPVMLHLWTG